MHDTPSALHRERVREAAGARYERGLLILRRGWLRDAVRAGDLLTATAQGLVGVRVRVDARSLAFSCTCGARAFCEHAAALALRFAAEDSPPGPSLAPEAARPAPVAPPVAVPSAPPPVAPLALLAPPAPPAPPAPLGLPVATPSPEPDAPWGSELILASTPLRPLEEASDAREPDVPASAEAPVAAEAAVEPSAPATEPDAPIAPPAPPPPVPPPPAATLGAPPVVLYPPAADPGPDPGAALAPAVFPERATPLVADDAAPVVAVVVAAVPAPAPEAAPEAAPEPAPAAPLRVASRGLLALAAPGRVALHAAEGEAFAEGIAEALRWFWWAAPRGAPLTRLEGDARTLARASALLAERGLALDAPRAGSALAGALAGYHQRTLGEDVYVRLQAPKSDAALALSHRLAAAGARPAPGDWPPSLWAVPEPAFAPWLVEALAEGAAVAPDAALNPKPLRGVTVLVDAGCLPARVREQGDGAPVRSDELRRALEAACRGPFEVDAAHGHALVPAARVVDVEETLRGLGADVAYRRLAPADARWLSWHDHLPEDATGARPRLRAPFSGPLDRPVPGLKPGVRLEAYQEEAVAFILHHDGTCLLADDMGLGKTLESIAAAQFVEGRVLVVCPASARDVWRREVEKFTTERALVLDRPAAAPRDLAATAEKYVVVSYNALEGFAAAVDSVPFAMAILDESHYVKNARSARAKSARDHVLRVPRRLVVSGTPVMNTPAEIRSQLAFLHPDEWSDAAWFKRRFEDPFDGGTPQVRDQILAKLRAFLEGVMLRREKRVALPDLPPKRIHWHRVDLPGEARRAYLELEEQFRAFVKEAGVAAAATAKAAGKIERLKQAALAGKMRAALAFVEELLEGGEKVVVFSRYRNALASAEKELARWGPVSITGDTEPEARAEAARRFQEDAECRVFLGQLVAAGTALTLTSATRCVFLDLDWNPANHRQAMDRIHRKGQTRPCHVHFFLACGTVDEDVEAALDEKGEMMDRLLDGAAARPAREADRAARRVVADRILARAA